MTSLAPDQIFCPRPRRRPDGCRIAAGAGGGERSRRDAGRPRRGAGWHDHRGAGRHARRGAGRHDPKGRQPCAGDQEGAAPCHPRPAAGHRQDQLIPGRRAGQRARPGGRPPSGPSCLLPSASTDLEPTSCYIRTFVGFFSPARGRPRPHRPLRGRLARRRRPASAPGTATAARRWPTTEAAGPGRRRRPPAAPGPFGTGNPRSYIPSRRITGQRWQHSPEAAQPRPARPADTKGRALDRHVEGAVRGPLRRVFLSFQRRLA